MIATCSDRTQVPHTCQVADTGLGLGQCGDSVRGFTLFSSHISTYFLIECSCVHYAVPKVILSGMTIFLNLMNVLHYIVSLTLLLGPLLMKLEILFLRASAMLKHVIAIVRLSHAGTLSKRLNILSWKANRNSYAIYQMVSFPMTLNEP